MRKLLGGDEYMKKISPKADYAVNLVHSPTEYANSTDFALHLYKRDFDKWVSYHNRIATDELRIERAIDFNCFMTAADRSEAEVCKSSLASVLEDVQNNGTSTSMAEIMDQLCTPVVDSWFEPGAQGPVTGNVCNLNLPSVIPSMVALM